MTTEELMERVQNSDQEIRCRLRQLRKTKGLSLRDLARKTGLSSSFLSQVERGKSNLSLRSLLALAEALEVTLADLCLEAEVESSPEADDGQEAAAGVSGGGVSKPLGLSPLVRAHRRPKLLLSSPDLVYELLVPHLGRKMIAVQGHLVPGTGNIARRLREPTEEILIVQSGALLVQLDQVEYVLRAGDSIYFEGQQLQRMECASDQETVWISVITPAVF